MQGAHQHEAQLLCDRQRVGALHAHESDAYRARMTASVLLRATCSLKWSQRLARSLQSLSSRLIFFVMYLFSIVLMLMGLRYALRGLGRWRFRYAY